MKQKLLSIATLLLCAVGTAVAEDTAQNYCWDFTNIPADLWYYISNTDVNSNSNSRNWVAVSSGTSYRYSYGQISGDSAPISLKIKKSQNGNNEEFAFTSGLTFKATKRATDSKNIIFHKVGASNPTTFAYTDITTPELEAGQIVTVEYKKSDGQYIPFTNLTKIDSLCNTNAKSGSYYVGKVAAKGAVTLNIGGSISLYRITVSSATTTATEATGLATLGTGKIEFGTGADICTFSSNLPLDFSKYYSDESCTSTVSGLMAYRLSGYSSDKGVVSTSEVKTAAPPMVGLLITKPSTVTGPVYVKTASPKYLGVNYLVQTVESTTVAPSTNTANYALYNYILGMSNNVIGFYNVDKADETSSENKKDVSAAGKAYLRLPGTLGVETSAAKFVGIDIFDNDVTGISDVKAETVATSDDAYYTLSGVKVSNPGKGLYIKNGKKVIVK